MYRVTKRSLFRRERRNYANTFSKLDTVLLPLFLSRSPTRDGSSPSYLLMPDDSPVAMANCESETIKVKLQMQFAAAASVTSAKHDVLEPGVYDYSR